jgi:hypothetical protein
VETAASVTLTYHIINAIKDATRILFASSQFKNARILVPSSNELLIVSNFSDVQLRVFQRYCMYATPTLVLKHSAMLMAKALPILFHVITLGLKASVTRLHTGKTTVAVL